MVRSPSLAGRAALRSLRQHQHQGSPEPEADALLVLGLPFLLQRQDWHRLGAVEGSPAEVGIRRLHLLDKPEVGFQHEIAPRPEGHAKDGMVHADASSGSVVG